MAMARLTESTNEDVIACLEEVNLGSDAARLERVDRFAIGERSVATTCVEHERDALELRRFACDELRQMTQQLRRQVVDHAKADVLEKLARGRLAGTGKAADDRDVRSRRLAVELLRHQSAAAPMDAAVRAGEFERATRRIVSSYRKTI